jgi:hypothetical protein
MLILIVGNPVSGFEYVGPFTTKESVMDYGENEYSHQEWWIVSLTQPKGVHNGQVRD